MPRSPAGCRGQATSSGNQGIRRILQPSTATPGDWAEDSRGDRAPASLAEARKAHHGSRPQWIAPRLPACCVSRESPEQPRTGFSASTPANRRSPHLIWVCRARSCPCSWYSTRLRCPACYSTCCWRCLCMPLSATSPTGSIQKNWRHKVSIQKVRCGCYFPGPARKKQPHLPLFY